MSNESKQIIKRLSCTLVIIFTFIAGHKILLPGLTYTNLYYNADLISVLMGYQIEQGKLVLFGLGLTPFMMSMLIVQLISFAKIFRMDEWTPHKLHVIQTCFFALIAILQAISFHYHPKAIVYFGFALPDIIFFWWNILFLLAGAFVIMWLSNMNSEYGIGGMMVILLCNILTGSVATLTKFIIDDKVHFSILLWIVIGFLLAFIMLLGIIMDQAEFRLPIRQVGLPQEYQKDAYLLLKLNPSGGVAVMYGMTFMTLPVIFASELLKVFPKAVILTYIVKELVLTKLAGVLTYLFLIYILTYLFSFINIDPESVAKSLQKNGDYFPGVKPGKDTLSYLKSKVRLIAHFASIFMTIFAGGPFLLAYFYQDLLPIATLPGLFLMMTGFSLQAIKQIRAISLGKDYRPLLDI